MGAIAGFSFIGNGDYAGQIIGVDSFLGEGPGSSTTWWWPPSSGRRGSDGQHLVWRRTLVAGPRWSGSPDSPGLRSSLARRCFVPVVVGMAAGTVVAVVFFRWASAEWGDDVDRARGDANRWLDDRR
jgi:hypothetical protein